MLRRLARSRALQAAAAGVVFTSATPPLDFSPGVVLGLALFFVSLSDASRARAAALRGWLFALTAGITGMAFLAGVVDRFTPLGMAGGVLGLVLISSLQALAWAIAAAIAHVLRARCLLAAPLAFAALVFVAICTPTVFSWTPASLLALAPELLQLADVIGERGVSALLALCAALLADPLARATERRAGRTCRGAQSRPLAAAALLAALWLHGSWRMAQVSRDIDALPRLELGVVQAAIDPEFRWKKEARPVILAQLLALTAEAERRGAALTLWPEAAYPYILSHKARAMPADEQYGILIDGVRGPVLFGLLTQGASKSEKYNSATLLQTDGVLQTPQAKMALLWFGETVPLSEQLPFLRKIFARAGHLTPGPGVALLEHGRARMGVLNCYEDTLPQIGRKIALARPNLLINVTNDAWFGPTAQPELHLRLSVLRAIESRLDLVRAVNLGVPAWIDASGRVRARGQNAEASVLRVAPALNDTSPTLYTKVGDIPIWLGLLVATVAAALRAGRQARRAAGPSFVSRDGRGPPAPITEPDPSEP